VNTTRLKKLKKERETQKHRIKKKELLGFLIIGLFIIFVAYLIIPPQRPQQETPLGEVSTYSSLHTSPSHKEPLSRAVIVDQLSFHFPNPEFIEEATNIIKHSGYDVDVYGPEKVTIKMYESLAAQGYRLIIFRVHAGVNEEVKERPVGLFTTESYSKVKYPTEQLSDLVHSAQAFNDSEMVFAVTPKFIREKSIMDYGGAVVILMGCFGIHSQDLPQAFIDRGVSVVVGWTWLVNLDHTDKATLILLRMMLLEKMDINNAVDTTMREVGPDPSNGSVLKYYPLSQSNLKIADILKIAYTHLPNLHSKKCEYSINN
jgi:hypothetical protein